MRPQAILALLWKDLRHHALMFLGFAMIAATGLMLSLQFCLARELDTLLSAGTGFVYYALPLLILGVSRRLFVVERLDGSDAFLAALPTSPWRVAAVRYFAGLLGLIAVAWAAVGGIAIVVSRQELVPFDGLLQIAWQCAAYVFAWFSLCFGFSQIGRWRGLGWMLVWLFLLSADGGWKPGIFAVASWHAVLGASIDETRHVAPLQGLAITLAWGFVASALGFALAGFRHGDLVERAWAPLSTRARGAIGGGILAYLTGLILLDVALAEPPPSLAFLPAVTRGATIVRVSDPEGGTLRGHAEALADELEALRVWLGEERLVTVVLIPADEDARSPAFRVAATDEELLLRVSDASRERVLDDAIQEVLSLRAGDQLTYDDDRAWVLAGAGWFWTGREAWSEGGLDSLAGRRAGYAASRGITAADLAEWQRLRARLGYDVSSGVAWAGLQVIVDRCGEARARAFVRRMIAPRGRSVISTLWMRGEGVGDALFEETGLSVAEHRTAWLALLEAAEATNAEALAGVPSLEVTFDREKDHDGRPQLGWTWTADAPIPVGLEVRWAVVPPLSTLPEGAWPRYEDAPVDTIRGEVGLDVDPRAPIAVTFAVRADPLDADVISGWIRLSPAGGP